MPTTRTFPVAAATLCAVAFTCLPARPAQAELTDRGQIVTYALGEELADGDSREAPVRVPGDTYIRVAFRPRGSVASEVDLVINTLKGPSVSGFSCATGGSPKAQAGQTHFTNVAPDAAIVCAASLQLPQGETYWGLVTATFAQGGSRATVSDQLHLISTSAPTGTDTKFGELPTNLEDVWALEGVPARALTRPSGWQPTPWTGGTRQLADTGTSN